MDHRSTRFSPWRHGCRAALRFLTDHRKDLIWALLLFGFALTTRLVYQEESITDRPFRADAARYVRGAYNLRYHGVYSLDRPAREPPKTRTAQPPGYPIFLAFFMGVPTPDFVRRVRRAQALLGALVAVLTFWIARQSLSPPWAGFAGILTALSPHLIAAEGYLITESYFTFVMMLGALILLISWRYEQIALALVAGFLVAFSAQIRTVGYALVFTLAPVLLIRCRNPSKLTPALRMISAALVLVGFLGVWGAHRVFVKLAVMNGESIEAEPAPFYPSPGSKLRRFFQPPNFAVRGQSHVLADHMDKTWIASTKESFRDQPVAYLKWNLGGKLLTMWSFDNSFSGDVYIYPMKRAGFRENKYLKAAHAIMRMLHWPLFVLALGAPILLLAQWWGPGVSLHNRPLLVPALGFAYFLGVLYLLSDWMPRYTIPARPFSYILAAATLSLLITPRLPKSRRLT